MTLVHRHHLLRGPEPGAGGGRIKDAEDDGLVHGGGVAQWQAVGIREETLVRELRGRVVVHRARRAERSQGHERGTKQGEEAELGWLHKTGAGINSGGGKGDGFHWVVRVETGLMRWRLKVPESRYSRLAPALPPKVMVSS